MNTEKLAAFGAYRIIDISQPIGERTACFPGDTPFSRRMTVTFEQSQMMNLTALTMSPHVGTHADAPVHVRGTMSGAEGVSVRGKTSETRDYAHIECDDEAIGTVSLDPFVGPVSVIDLSPHRGPIEIDHITDVLAARAQPPQRVIFKTIHRIRYHVFEHAYAHFTVELVDRLAQIGVQLIGIDAPSVDHIDSKSLAVHHRLLARNMAWLENLDLTNAHARDYFLIALPLKFMQLEASPVRAVLLD
jgi:arylformamidase